MEDKLELPRLEFLRKKIESKDEILSGIITPAFQGKIFYINKNNGEIYTQARDILGGKLYIRGNQIPLEIIEGFSARLKNIPFEKNLTLIFMLGRQDLLITHKNIQGTQCFFLGVLEEHSLFTPGIIIYKKYKDYFDAENITPSKFYRNDGDFSVPDQLSIEEVKLFLDVSGAIVRTENQKSIVLCTEIAYKIFELFSDTQNNLQLWVKCVFHDNFINIQSIPIIMKTLDVYLPDDKILQFREYYGYFNGLVNKFSSKKFSYSLTNDQHNFYINYELTEENKKIFQKSEKSLNTFINHIKINLKRGFLSNERQKLHLQVQAYILSFFKLHSNINNCCHLIKRYEKIEVK